MGDQRWFTMQWVTNPIYTKTLLMFAAYGCVGWSDSLFGVNLTQLQVHFGSSTGDTSYLVQASSIGFTMGNAMLSNLILPHIPSLPYMALFFFLAGFSGGSLEAVCISRILHIWGRESVTLLQLLDFGYGVGAIAGLFLTAPFLPDTRLWLSQQSDNLLISSNRTNTISLKSDLGSPVSISMPQIDLISPYSIAGSTFALVAVSSLWFWVKHRMDAPILIPHTGITELSLPSSTPSPPSSTSSSSSSTSSSPTKKLSRLLKGILICLVATTYAFANGMGMIEQSFLTVYVTKEPFNLNPARGARLEGATWLVHTISGVLFLPVIHKIGIGRNLLLGCCFICWGNLFMLFCSPSGEEWVLWCGLLLVSVGATTFFGSLIALMENNFQVSPRVTSLFLIPNCISNIVWPFIVGHLIDDNPQYFMYCLTFCGFMASFLVVITLSLIRICFPKNHV